MIKPIQPASIDAKSQPVQNTPTPVVNTSSEYERQNLKDLVSLQLKELLFKEVLKNNLENETKIKGKISINFLNNRQNPKSIPVRDITLQTLPYTIDKVTNLILANKNYNAYILPFVSDNGSAEQCNVMGGESLIIDLDEGNTDEKLKLITQTFGTPSIILKSGSIVNGEYPCRHIYYKFDEYLSGDRFKKLLDIRGKIAKGFGGDEAYARNSAQLVRIFGSFNHKKGTKRVSEIEQNNLATAIYTFDDFCITADKYFAENPIVEKNIPHQLPLTANSSNKEESVETLDFPIHQPPLELNDEQVIDYLNALVPDIFAKGNYELWLKALFATFHQYKGSEKGKQIFQEFSLTDNSRPEKEILESINQHWKYSKCEKTNQKVTTFRTIIAIVNNKDFVANEIEKNLGEEKFVSVADVELTLAKYNVGKIINVFGCLDYQKWQEVVIALSNNFNGDEIGYKLALDWSLTDSTRLSDEIVKSVEIEYKKDRKNHPNPITFRTIIKKANDLQLVLDNTALVEKYGRPIDIKAINDNEKYILTENKLLYTIKKRTGLKIFELCNFIQLLGYGTGSEGQLFLEILTKNFKGEYVKSILQQSLKSDELLLRLQDKQLCVDTINFSYLRRYLSIFKADKEIGILSKSGWDAVDWKSYEEFSDNWDKRGNFNLLYLDRVDSYPLNNSGDCVKNYLEFRGVNLKEYLDTRGSFTGWQNNIVKYAVNNDLVSFTLFTAFSAIFYTPLKTRSAIYHFFGESSQGKSVLLDIAMSVMGFAVNEGNPSGYIKWSATENGLEGLCAAKNDMLLCLDELTAVSDPKLIYNAAYMIVNGQGKVRASSRGTGYGNRVTKNWKTTAISTGEVPLKQKLEDSGQEVMGGQEARFLDIPAVMDIFGVFNDLHGFKNSFDLVKHFETESANFKGFAIREFIKYVTIDNKFSDILKEFRHLKTLWLDTYFETITDINTNQLKSVADNFAFVAAAGEVAIKGNIFAHYFKEFDAFKVVNNVFRRYLENLGDYTVTSEERKIVRNLKDFLRQKIALSFWERPKENPFNNNMITKSDNQGWYGYKEDNNFYLLIDRVVEICGFNAEKVFNVLKKKKIILKDKTIKNDKPSSYKYRLRFRPYGDSARPYFYLLDLSALGMADYLTDDNFPDPTSPEPTEKLKYLPCDNPSNSSSNIEPIVVNTDSSNSSTVTNTTVVAPSLILPRNNLLSLLNSLDANTLYSIGVTMRPIEPNLGILTDYEPITLHIFELIKNEMWVIDISTEPFTKEEQEAFRKLKLVTNSLNRIIEVLPMYMLENVNSSLLAYAVSDEKDEFFTLSIFSDTYSSLKEIENNFDNFKADLKDTYYDWEAYNDCDRELYEEKRQECYSAIKVDYKNYIMRSRSDLASISVGCFQEYVMCAGIVEGEAKNPDNLRYLLLKKKNEKPIVIKLENGLTKEEQEILKSLELVFSKINMDTEQYLPNLNYNWVHFLDIALLTRDSATNMIQTLKEPFYILQDDTTLEELLSAISNDLIKNEGIFIKIEPEILNEFRYRNTIFNEYDKVKHVPY